jgi:5-formyltetrahydrofolate cyclo-ligase
VSNESVDQVVEAKQALRRAIRQARAGLPAAERTRQSIVIAEQLFQRTEIISAQIVHCYLSMPTEVDTMAIGSLFAAGKEVVVPWMNDDGTMASSAFLAEDVADVHEIGKLRVPQPPIFRSVPGGCWDVVIVPLVAATANGSRLGNGAGHYDRLLSTWPRPAIGVALDVQMVASLPVEPHDITLDAIITA